MESKPGIVISNNSDPNPAFKKNLQVTKSLLIVNFQWIDFANNGNGKGTSALPVPELEELCLVKVKDILRLGVTA